jgi:glucosamine-6-phosphate deaminase
MTIKVIITRDFDHMSEIAAEITKEIIIQTLEKKKDFIFGLATGNSPTGMYKYLTRMANTGVFDSSRIRSFNLDEYAGLPGENAQQRTLHPESYCYFMIQEFFGLLDKKFIETSVPYGCLIDQQKLENELDAHPEDWVALGTDAGKSISIKENATSEYLKWIQETILEGYAQKIANAGGIDLQIIGVGGRGHVAFHESGIPFEGSSVLLVKLDDNTVENAVIDGHFATKEDSPRFAISMGAELVYKAKQVILLANGERKVESVTTSLINDPTPDIPISYGQTYSKNGGILTYVLDKIAGRELLAHKDVLKAKDIEIEEIK